MRNGWIGFVAVVIVTACGDSTKTGGSGGSSTLHCAYSSQGACITISAPAISAAQQTALQNECTADGGSYGTGGCSTANAVPGTCTVTDPQSLPTTHVAGMTATATFYSPTFNATSAAAQCASMGTWSAGGGGGGGSNITTARCSYASGMCATFTAPAITPAQQTGLQAECTGDGGTWATSACATTNAVAGVCTVTNASFLPTTQVASLVTTIRFYTPSFNATSAATQCGAMGSWSGTGGGGGGGGTNITAASCAFATDAGCLTFSAPAITPTQQGSLQTQCTSSGGAYAASACSATNALPGTCTVTTGSPWTALGISGLTVVATFYTPTWDATEATSWCESVNGGGGGGGGTSITAARCDFPTDGACFSFSAPAITPTQQAAFQGECAAGGGTYGGAACSSSNAVPGTCAVTDPATVTSASISGLAVTATFYSSIFNATTAASTCGSIGTWSGGGGGGGGGGTNVTAASCAYTADGNCVTYAAPAITPAQQAAIQSQCSTGGGSYAAGTCSTTSAVAGTCTVTDPTALATTTIVSVVVTGTFYTSSWDGSTAAAACGTVGTWTGSGGGGGGGGGGTVASGDLSCNLPSLSQCVTVNAPAYTAAELASLEGDCTSSGGTLVSGACPTANAVAGTCTLSDASYPPTQVAGLTATATYYGPTYNATSAATQCGTIGTWSGGGGGGGGGGTNITVARCDFQSQGGCFTYTAPAITPPQQTALQGECSANLGTYGAGACSTTSAVPGTCALTDPAIVTSVSISGLAVTATFYTPTFDATSAANTCGPVGTWSGGGGGGGGGTNITSATCTYSGYCATFTAPAITPAQQTALQSDCAHYAGTYGGTAPCPTTNAIPGTCALTDPATATSAAISGLVVDVTFYSPTFDAGSAANVCGTAGTWSGGGGGGGTVASGDVFCNYTGNSVCFTVNAPAYTAAQLTSLQGECSGGGGTSGMGACPTTNAVAGTCTVTNASYLPTTTVAGLTETATFYSPTFNGTTAGNACATFGTWGGGSGAGGGGGGGGGTTSIESCAIPGSFYCLEFRGTSISAPFTTAFVSMCTANSGTYATAPCPTANVVPGYCQYDASGDLGPGGTERDYLYGPTYTVADAQAMCTTPGTWVP